jgi:hypothetical protein
MIGGEHRAEALVTEDGAFRLHISSLDRSTESEGSAQFIGEFAHDDSRGFGAGIVIGQECAALEPGRLCNDLALAEIEVSTATRNLMSGELRVSTSQGEETWPFELTFYFSYLVAADLQSIDGQYKEWRAQFADGDDLVINVDTEGQLFFQGPNSGCIGNGSLQPHADGAFHVYDASITIDRCVEQYASFNRAYEGLATSVTDFYYGENLILWLSALEGTTPPVAVTMSAWTL